MPVGTAKSRGTHRCSRAFTIQSNRNGSGAVPAENENKTARITPGRTPLAPREKWFNPHQAAEGFSMLSTILLIILILILLGALPAWPYSRGWGYGPSGVVGLLVIVMVVLLLTGRL